MQTRIFGECAAAHREHTLPVWSASQSGDRAAVTESGALYDSASRLKDTDCP